MKILRANDRPSLPWKNGLGVSRIVAADPAGAGYDDLRWQVGTTRIEADCPISRLNGLDRLFVVLEGAGVELTCRESAESDPVRQAIGADSEPFSFRGDWETACRLRAGAVRVLNVVARRQVAQAGVARRWVRERVELAKAPGETLLVYAIAGRLSADESGAVLSADDALLLDVPDAARIGIRPVDGPARALTVSIRPNRAAAGQ